MRAIYFLEEDDRKLLRAHAHEPSFLSEIVMRVARQHKINLTEANAALGRVIDCETYPNIDDDAMAQTIGQGVLWLVNQHTMGIVKKEIAGDFIFWVFCVIAALILVCLLQDATNYFLLSGVHDVPPPL